jgi:hypothetical protein
MFFSIETQILRRPEKQYLSAAYGFEHGSERLQVACWDPRTPRLFDKWYHLELVWKKLQSYSKTVQHLSAKIMKQGLRIARTVINWWKSLQFCEGTFGIIITR